jgi:hypothetical protein
MGRPWQLGDFVILVFLVSHLIAIVGIFFVLILVFVVIFRDHVYVHWMSLHNLQLGLTFRAIKDLALLHFVLIHIDFNGTFGAANHGITSGRLMLHT